MRLSIIIAVYNGEKTIARALNSVLNSSLNKNEYEIIIINDGSTDSTVKVVTPYLNQYHNIKLINKNNGGQSTARNIGFEEARGKYIFCLDSDDYITSERLEPLLSRIELKNCDITAISYIEERESGGDKTIIAPYVCDAAVYSVGEFFKSHTIYGIMWLYFFKADIIKRYNLRLIEGIFHEDEEFVIKYLCHCKEVFIDKTPLYHYVFNEQSTVNKQNIEHRKKLIYDILTVIESLEKTMMNRKNDELIYKGLLKKQQQLCFSVVLRILKERLGSSFLEEIIKYMSSKNMYPLKTNYLKLKIRIVSKLFNSEKILKLVANF